MIKTIIKFFLLGIVSIFIIFIMIIEISSINEEITKGERYGFSIGDTKLEVYDTIQKMRRNLYIDYMNLGFFLRRYSVEDIRKLYKYFLEWEVKFKDKEDILKLTFNDNRLDSIKLILPNIRQALDDYYYKKIVLKKYYIQSDSIKVGMNIDKVLSILIMNQNYAKITFFDSSITENINPELIKSKTGDNWDIVYNSIFGVDYLELYFEKNRLVKMARLRYLIEVP